MNADLVFGIHAVEAFLQRAPQDVLELFVMKDRDDKRMQPIIQLARQNGVSVQFC
ncbi:MAG: 23S rRNA (guanosine(2251)-2'-O)-methyltransferase RlmB, partial [Gammaproteobacteria bacterium]|nr:23S rRNA (guanosine(2251)-2'-O)-methyltransferase RlmB [Gammaproteobacteria bacterium]